MNKIVFIQFVFILCLFHFVILIKNETAPPPPPSDRLQFVVLYALVCCVTKCYHREHIYQISNHKYKNELSIIVTKQHISIIVVWFKESWLSELWENGLSVCVKFFNLDPVPVWLCSCSTHLSSTTETFLVLTGSHQQQVAVLVALIVYSTG